MAEAVHDTRRAAVSATQLYGAAFVQHNNLQCAWARGCATGLHRRSPLTGHRFGKGASRAEVTLSVPGTRAACWAGTREPDWPVLGQPPCAGRLVERVTLCKSAGPRPQAGAVGRAMRRRAHMPHGRRDNGPGASQAELETRMWRCCHCDCMTTVFHQQGVAYIQYCMNSPRSGWGRTSPIRHDSLDGTPAFTCEGRGELCPLRDVSLRCHHDTSHNTACKPAPSMLRRPLNKKLRCTVDERRRLLG
eukprot:355037-Chlamydomonas_euryale.AAC.3